MELMVVLIIFCCLVTIMLGDFIVALDILVRDRIPATWRKLVALILYGFGRGLDFVARRLVWQV